MKQEVEILFRIKEDASIAKRNIIKFGGKYIKTTKVVDTYFYNNFSSQFRPSIKGRLNGCLRIRVKDNKSFYTYKEDYFNNDGSWLYSDEYETEISDANSLKNALQKQGFKILTVVDSIKHYYIYTEYEICVEEVKSLGTFVEIEHNSNFLDDIEVAKQEIRNVMTAFEFNDFTELDSGKPELMIHYKRKKAFISYKFTNEEDLDRLSKIINSITLFLNRHNVDCYSSINDINFFKNNNFSDIDRIKYLNNKIDDSDFLLAIINNGSESKGLMYEMGYANSRNKQIFLIYSSENDLSIEKQIATDSLKYNILDEKINKNIIKKLLSLD